MRFHHWLTDPPTDPLNPINPDNACTLRITAAAGTELAGAYSYGTVRRTRMSFFLSISNKWNRQFSFFFFFQAEDGIRDHCVTGVQTCALPIYRSWFFFFCPLVPEGRKSFLPRFRKRGSTCFFFSFFFFFFFFLSQNGRASCRERGVIWGGAGRLKKKKWQ